MDLLITMIGNAVVDRSFRERFLNNPVAAMDEYQFRLTKGDFEMMTAVFGGLKEKEEREALEKLFLTVENALYQRLEAAKQIAKPPIPPCRPCFWSVYPPKQFRSREDSVRAA